MRMTTRQQQYAAPLAALKNVYRDSIKLSLTEHWLLPMSLEYWCSENCMQDWSLDQENAILTFTSPSDHALFRLTKYARLIIS